MSQKIFVETYRRNTLAESKLQKAYNDGKAKQTDKLVIGEYCEKLHHWLEKANVKFGVVKEIGEDVFEKACWAVYDASKDCREERCLFHVAAVVVNDSYEQGERLWRRPAQTVFYNKNDYFQHGLPVWLYNVINDYCTRLDRALLEKGCRFVEKDGYYHASKCFYTEIFTEVVDAFDRPSDHSNWFSIAQDVVLRSNSDGKRYWLNLGEA